MLTGLSQNHVVRVSMPTLGRYFLPLKTVKHGTQSTDNAPTRLGRPTKKTEPLRDLAIFDHWCLLTFAAILVLAESKHSATRASK